MTVSHWHILLQVRVLPRVFFFFTARKPQRFVIYIKKSHLNFHISERYESKSCNVRLLGDFPTLRKTQPKNIFRFCRPCLVFFLRACVQFLVGNEDSNVPVWSLLHSRLNVYLFGICCRHLASSHFEASIHIFYC